MVDQLISGSARLYPADLIDARALRYAVNTQRLRAVFDGDVLLEQECYAVDPAQDHLTLKRTPAFEIKVLLGEAIPDAAHPVAGNDPVEARLIEIRDAIKQLTSILVAAQREAERWRQEEAAERRRLAGRQSRVAA